MFVLSGRDDVGQCELRAWAWRIYYGVSLSDSVVNTFIFANNLLKPLDTLNTNWLLRAR